jgi:protein phosphatase
MVDASAFLPKHKTSRSVVSRFWYCAALNEIVIPSNTLVVLCGPAGCGKSTWAAKHFSPTQVVSSDNCRAVICDDPTNQLVSGHAFDLMYYILEKRLTLGRLSVADATNLKREHRSGLIRIAEDFQFQSVAVVFDLPIEICLQRNAGRERRVPPEAVEVQYELLERTLDTISSEPFNRVHILNERTQSNVRIRIGRQVNLSLPPPPVRRGRRE